MNQIVSWASLNLGTILTLAWLIGTATFNVAMRFKTAEEWIAFGERRPFMAAGIRIIRALGIDPAKALISIGDALTAHAQRTKNQ